jgi:ribosomal protein S18 acetylase RimI-like enzyme
MTGLETYRFAENTAPQPQLVSLLKACDASFMPPLSDRVDIDSYATKLFNRAERIEAWFQSELVGLLGIYLTAAGAGAGFISNVCVHPSHGGHGVGSALIELCKQRALRDMFTAIELEVCIKNLPVVSLYQRHGFSFIRTSGDIGTMVCALTETDKKDNQRGNHE